MRLLFRLISFVVLVLTVYFFLNLSLSPDGPDKQDWIIIKNQSGLELAFPDKPRQQTSQKIFPQIGSSQLNSFQTSHGQALFALLIVQPKEVDLQQHALKSLNQAIHVINDTHDLKIQAERHFQYESFPAYEYLAARPDGVTTWCRTIHTGKALLSLIYAHQAGQVNTPQRDRFYQSLQF